MPAQTQAVQRVLNCIPSQNVDHDWEFEHARDAHLLRAAGALPATVDLRATWWKVGDQGATGSCVGWASGDGLIRWHLVNQGRIARNERVSVRYLWMAAKESDTFISQPTTFIENAGTSLKAALDIARKFGIVLERVVPFNSGKLYPGDEKSFYALASRLKIASYFNLRDNFANWRSWLATSGPLLVRLDVDATWDQATATGGNLDTYQPATRRGGHAVTIVGYTPDRFIVRNSWGAAWGDKGFAYASLDYARAAFTNGFFTEAYGVTIA
jgi:hypothetical protein